MATSNGTFTDQTNLLNLFGAWAVTSGWTQNLLADDTDTPYEGSVGGRRLHIQKTIDGTPFYFNFRTMDNQRVISGGSRYSFTGLAVNGSLGFDSADRWDKQVGFTTDDYIAGSDSAAGGIADDNIGSGGDYHFFAQDRSLSMAIKCTGSSKWLAISVGAVGDRPAYTSSNPIDFHTTYINRFNMRVVVGSVQNRSYGTSIFDGTSWIPSRLYYSEQTGYKTISNACCPYNNWATTYPTSTTRGSFEYPLLRYSQDDIRGNSVLAPCVFNLVNEEQTLVTPAGTFDGLRYLNMKYIADEQVVSLDGTGNNDYMCFNTSTTYDIGYAFQK